MYAVIENDKILYQVSPGQRLIVNGTDYGKFWHQELNAGQLESLGVKEIQINMMIPDQRFFWVTENLSLENGVPKLNYSIIDKDIEQLKTSWISQIKENAKINLNQTDWYVLRKFERNIDIPQEVIYNRANIISKCDTTVTNIQNAGNALEIMNIVTTS